MNNDREIEDLKRELIEIEENSKNPDEDSKIINNKNELLCKLHEFAIRGAKWLKGFSLQSSLEDLQSEYLRLKDKYLNKKNDDMIAFKKQCILNKIKILEEKIKENLNEKKYLLYQLEKAVNDGWTLTKQYDLNSTPQEMNDEFNKYRSKKIKLIYELNNMKEYGYPTRKRYSATTSLFELICDYETYKKRQEKDSLISIIMETVYSCDLKYLEFPHNFSYDSLKLVYEILIENKEELINYDFTDSIILYYIGVHYYIKKNESEFVKFFELSFKYGQDLSYFLLIMYFIRKKNFVNVDKYIERLVQKDSKYKYIYYDAATKIQYSFGDNKMYYKYLIIGATLNENKCITCINAEIERNDKAYDLITHAYKHKYLSKKNMIKFNKMLISYIKLNDFITENNLHHLIDQKEDCCICLENNVKIDLSCKHSLCYKCYEKINKCPICRQSFIEEPTNFFSSLFPRVNVNSNSAYMQHMLRFAEEVD